jgi:alkanesulfonate monooxygenase SsuD/methylene tetrahydromethanopterin reductase-like flavin-dependent oxidoreductase (luciferase family)
LSRFIFAAADKRAALAQIQDGVLRGAEGFVQRGQFPAGLSIEEYLQRFHAFYGHPDEIIEALQAEQALPLATDLIAQFNPGVPDHDAAIRSLELIATEIAPALGWSPARATEPQPATV